MTCQLGTLTEVRPLELDNVKYARGHDQYFSTPHQLKVQWWLQVVQGPSGSWLKLQWGDNLCEMCDITHYDAT